MASIHTYISTKQSGVETLKFYIVVLPVLILIQMYVNVYRRRAVVLHLREDEHLAEVRTD